MTLTGLTRPPNVRMKKRQPPRMITRRSGIHGRGVFANRDFAPHEVIIARWDRYEGTVVYLNHSCQPSCYTRQPVKRRWATDILVAGPNGIKAGEELTFDYRLTRWEKLWRKTVGDSCGCARH